MSFRTALAGVPCQAAASLQWRNSQCRQGGQSSIVEEASVSSAPFPSFCAFRQPPSTYTTQARSLVGGLRGEAVGAYKLPWHIKVRPRRHHNRVSALTTTDVEEWSKKLPEKKVPLYSHSLPCIEAWLKSLNFFQSKDDRSVWIAERPDWHAQLSLDITELYIRYQKSGPGNLERDVERKFSYALSREDVENAILGGP